MNDAPKRSQARPFTRLLVANRGEVALRIARAARKLGIAPLGVWSDADRGAPHLEAMVDSCRLGESPARASYLSVERTIEAALHLRADSIHPGYGFLAESPELAEAAATAGLVFVGPRAETIRLLADKARAKEVAHSAGVPVIPWIDLGSASGDVDGSDPASSAGRLGYPLLVKAVAGGGGRGMRRVEREADLREALAAAAAESLAAFGDSRLLLERALDGARHVEVQVLADEHGSVLHLGERDCSSQRRHQKVVEEAPAPDLAPDVRRRLLEAAVRLARSVGYVGAGTVEMLVHGGEIYFLEVNTRLQVEHPVTEEVHGIDVVEWQLRVARGERLAFAQADLTPHGHAIEARLYAEDPAHGFAPRPGCALVFRPGSGSGVRVESALRDGAEVSPHYDPMVAKVIAHGADREEARRRLVDALERTVVFGLETNRDFLVDYLRSSAFAPPSGAPNTGTLSQFAAGWRPGRHDDLSGRALCALGLTGLIEAWSRGIAPWWSAAPLPAFVSWELEGGAEGGARGEARVLPLAQGRPRFAVSLSTESGVGSSLSEPEVEIQLLPVSSRERVSGGVLHRLDVLWGGDAGRERESVELWIEGGAADGTSRLPAEVFAHRAGRTTHLRRRSRAAAANEDPGALRAPMAGQVTQVLAQAGQRVDAGQTLFVLEAMKLEARVRSPCAGVLTAVAVRPGEHVPHRWVLGRVEAAADRVTSAKDP